MKSHSKWWVIQRTMGSLLNHSTILFTDDFINQNLVFNTQMPAILKRNGFKSMVESLVMWTDVVGKLDASMIPQDDSIVSSVLFLSGVFCPSVMKQKASFPMPCADCCSVQKMHTPPCFSACSHGDKSPISSKGVWTMSKASNGSREGPNIQQDLICISGFHWSAYQCQQQRHFDM